MGKAPAGKLRSPPAAVQGQQTGGRRAQDSTVYRGRSQLTPGTQERKKTRAPPQTPAQGAQLRLHFTPGTTKSPGQSWSSERSRGGWAATVPSVPPGSSTICTPLWSSQTPGAVRGRACGQNFGGGVFPARRSARTDTFAQPAPVSAQLANSGTFAKLPRAGQPPRSGPHHRGPRGGRAQLRGPRLAGPDGQEPREGRGPRRTEVGRRARGGRRGERGSAGSGAEAATTSPPPWRRRGGRGRLPGRRAAEVPRSWSGAGAAAASPRRAAAAAGRTGGRAELGAARRGRRGAAGLTGPDEAEGEAASAGGGAGAGGPGPSAQRGALGAVPRAAARRHPGGIGGGGGPGGRTGESPSCVRLGTLSPRIHLEPSVPSSTFPFLPSQCQRRGDSSVLPILEIGNIEAGRRTGTCPGPPRQPEAESELETETPLAQSGRSVSYLGYHPPFCPCLVSPYLPASLAFGESRLHSCIPG